MLVELARMPWGEYLGAAVVAVEVAEEDGEDAAELVRLVSAALTLGTACIWLRDVPWEAEWWTQVLWGLERAPVVQELGATMVSTHRPEDPTWPAGSVLWAMDCTVMMATEATPQAIKHALENLPLFPRVNDLIVRDPASENLLAQNLDAIAYTIQPDRRVGQLLIPWERCNDPALIKTLARCETPWTVVPA